MGAIGATGFFELTTGTLLVADTAPTVRPVWRNAFLIIMSQVSKEEKGQGKAGQSNWPW